MREAGFGAENSWVLWPGLSSWPQGPAKALQPSSRNAYLLSTISVPGTLLDPASRAERGRHGPCSPGAGGLAGGTENTLHEGTSEPNGEVQAGLATLDRDREGRRLPMPSSSQPQAEADRSPGQEARAKALRQEQAGPMWP